MGAADLGGEMTQTEYAQESRSATDRHSLIFDEPAGVGEVS